MVDRAIVYQAIVGKQLRGQARCLGRMPWQHWILYAGNILVRSSRIIEPRWHPVPSHRNAERQLESLIPPVKRQSTSTAEHIQNPKDILRLQVPERPCIAGHVLIVFALVVSERISSSASRRSFRRDDARLYCFGKPSARESGLIPVTVTVVEVFALGQGGTCLRLLRDRGGIPCCSLG